MTDFQLPKLASVVTFHCLSYGMNVTSILSAILSEVTGKQHCYATSTKK